MACCAFPVGSLRVAACWVSRPPRADHARHGLTLIIDATEVDDLHLVDEGRHLGGILEPVAVHGDDVFQTDAVDDQGRVGVGLDRRGATDPRLVAMPGMRDEDHGQAEGCPDPDPVRQ